jgi:flagellar motor switch protein FliN
MKTDENDTMLDAPDIEGQAQEKSPIERAKKTGSLVRLDSEIFSDVSVKLTVTLGNGTIVVRDLLNLSEGSLIELDTPLDGMVKVMLNNRVVAHGEIVAVGDQFGVRVTKIIAQKA